MFSEHVCAAPVQFESCAVGVDEILELDGLSLCPASGRPVGVRQPGVGSAKDCGLQLLEQTRPSAGLNWDAVGLQCVEDAGVGDLAPHQYRNVSVRHSLAVQRDDVDSDRVRLGLLVEVAGGDRNGVAVLGPVCEHLLVETARDRVGELIGELDDRCPRPAVDQQPELRHAVVAVGEGHDVGDVRSAPLVNGLVIVADDDQVCSAGRLR